MQQNKVILSLSTAHAYPGQQAEFASNKLLELNLKLRADLTRMYNCCNRLGHPLIVYVVHPSDHSGIHRISLKVLSARRMSQLSGTHNGQDATVLN